MNRPTIMDLRPGHSFVEYMVGKGYDIYLLDRGIPGPEDKKLKFDDYTLDYMPQCDSKDERRCREARNSACWAGALVRF